jgi:hypothetical protein
MPKKPRDQSREEKNGSENQRTFSSVTLAALASQEAQVSMSRMLKLSVRHVDCGLQLRTGDGAMERDTLHHCNSGEKLRRRLGFQMDDI